MPRGKYERKPVLPLIPQERFWGKVEIDLVTGCWNWIACRNKDGYGLFSMSGRSRLAHRLAYEWTNGKIPIGLEPHHKCHNPSCINPHHLELLSRKEHMMVSDSIGARNARATHCPQGHPYDKENTIVDKRGRHCLICKRIADRRYREPFLHPYIPITHCKRGHEFTTDNTYITPSGRRNCKECLRIAERKYRNKVEA